MKKMLFLIAILLVAFCAPAFAQQLTWMPLRQFSVTWDPVTQKLDADGNSVDITEGTIEYQVFQGKLDKSDIKPLWRGPETHTVLSLAQEGRLLLGIKSILVVDGQDVSESEIAWTDDPEIVYQGQIFGIIYFLPPKRVSGFQGSPPISIDPNPNAPATN